MLRDRTHDNTNYGTFDRPVHEYNNHVTWKYNDGGRSDSGYTGTTGDCVVRAIAIATDQPYKTVYKALHRKGASPRNGVSRPIYTEYLRSLGWTWTATMHIGSGCTMHLRADELPRGRIIARLSRHMVAVIDGVVHDTYDSARDGTRCVYGYWTAAAETQETERPTRSAPYGKRWA